MTSPALDEVIVDRTRKEYGFLLDNKWQKSHSGQTIEILSPIDNSLVGHVQRASIDETNAAVESAFLAQKQWENFLIHERVDILIHTAALLDRYSDLFVDLLVLEIGKPKIEARDEVLRTVDLIIYYAEEGRRMFGEAIPSHAFPDYKKKKLAITKRVPLGVVLAISPFNYPINEVAPKIVSALVMGNSVVLKPATQGSICALHFAALFKEAGLPSGVLNVVTGEGGVVGDTLVSNPLISGINFTGSYETAKTITEKAGVKKLIFGLSGKDASIVLPDADLDLAAGEIASGSFSYGGQRCTGIKRVLVHEAVADIFVEKLVGEVAKTFIIGDPRNDGVTLGPVINDKTANYISELINQAVDLGAVVRLGGKRNGRFIEPTILDGVTTHMRLAFEEPFGPVLPIMRIKTEEEGVAFANQSEYGLQASIFTRDIDKAFALSDSLEVATVQINGKDARSPDHFPFTGFKHSGLGMVQGARYLLEEVSKIKTIVVNTR